MPESTKFEQAITLFDEANSKDPNTEIVDNQKLPKELAYARRMTKWLEKMDPEASEELKLAVRAQHIERWKIPRDEYPKTRRGYHKWRNRLKQYHAERAGEILREAGYDNETINRIQDLIKKKRIKTDPEAQLMEDVICLVFLENYFTDFASKHDDKKVIKIIRKTWKKMSEKGHKKALQLDMPPKASDLVKKALAE